MNMSAVSAGPNVSTLDGIVALVSDEMKVVERYKRLNYGTLDVELTVIDPKAYTKPLSAHDTIKLVPDTELSEAFCAPSDANDFADKVVKPVTGSSTLHGAQRGQQ